MFPLELTSWKITFEKKKSVFYILPLNLKKLVKIYFLTLEAPSPQNGQKHSQNSSASFADELLECVWPFCGVGT